MSDDASLYLKELQKQKDRIQEALDQMSQGTLPDMTEIDRDVFALCGAIETAPPEIAKQTEQDLRSMISMLEDLAGRIQEFKDGLSGEGV